MLPPPPLSLKIHLLTELYPEVAKPLLVPKRSLNPLVEDRLIPEIVTSICRTPVGILENVIVDPVNDCEVAKV
jgi:hypothetical protein